MLVCIKIKQVINLQDKLLVTETLRDIRRRSNTKETTYSSENSYGRRFRTIHYYNKGVHIARIFKTDGEIVHIETYPPPEAD